MEVVLLVVAVIGIALIVVPRLKGNRRARRSLSSVKARRRAAVAAAAAPGPAAVSTWSPSPGSDEDGWDDDLGWEGGDRPAPETRETWERWRETESPLAAAPEPAVPSAELPSVERWRAAASEETEWLDDDGLGWEGEESRSEPRVWVAEPAAHAVAAPEVTTHVEPAESAGREWPTTPATNGNGHTVAAPVSSPAQRRFGLHPVLMVALYAAAGIGVVVLASTVLLGGSSAPEPVSNPAPKTPPKSSGQSAPQVNGSLADEEFDVSVEPEDSATTAARKARRAFERERARALAAERKAAQAKAAAVRRKAAAEQRRREQRRQSRAGSPGSGGSSGGGTPPPVSPPSSGGGSPQGGGSPAPQPAARCEFCIG